MERSTHDCTAHAACKETSIKEDRMLKEKSQGDNVEEWQVHGEQIELQIESEASHAVGWADAGQTTGTKEEQRGSGSRRTRMPVPYGCTLRPVVSRCLD